jgi:hypothetical protein
VTDQDDRRKRAVAITGAAAVTAALVALALYLGGWAHETRRTSLHEARLQHLVDAKPHEDQVMAALEQEGMRAVEKARTPVDVATLASHWGGPHYDAVVDAGSAAALTRAFTGSGYTYILYFDKSGTLIGFTFVGG